MGTIVLATCAAWPDVSVSDECLAAALRTRGFDVSPAPWNGDFVPFTRAAAVVVRSTWDFHEAPAGYVGWLGRLDPRRTFNAPALIRWNLAKTHVLALGSRRTRSRYRRNARRDREPSSARRI